MILGSICGRGGSQGVPRKNVRPLNGKPLLTYTIECARAAKRLDRVVVSTDDDEIADVARRQGVEVPFMRPAELATGDASKWDVFRHLVSTLEQADGTRIDVLVDLDIAVPLRRPEDVDDSIELLLQQDVDVVITAYEADRNPYFNMVEEQADGTVKVVNATNPPTVCRQHAPQVYSLSPAVYAMRRECLFAVEHWSQARMMVHPIPRLRAIDIDSESDYAMVEFLMQKHTIDQ